MAVGVAFEGVWKKFSRGEVHDSLRDLVPALLGRLTGRSDDSLREREFWVLRDLSFRVGPGEALGIIGPNGSGKSTTLKLLSHILRPTRGRVVVEGRIGALIEVAAGFHPDLTGRENVFLQGAIMGMRRSETREKFDQIVDFSGVGDFIDTQVKRYSSGMNARLGFAIAAHLEPDVLLIDEVLAVGDLSFQQRCHERLSEIRESGVPIVFVSHNLQAVTSLCDRALLLRPGGSSLLGPVSEVVSEYTSGARQAADPRIRVRSARLVDDGGEAPTTAVDPGTWLTLELDLLADEDLGRRGLSLVVTRADGHRVFDGMVQEELVDLREGRGLRGSIRFRANLLRGTYTVGVVLFEEERRDTHARLEGLATFVVEERTRHTGCAELEPVARLTRTEGGSG